MKKKIIFLFLLFSSSLILTLKHFSQEKRNIEIKEISSELVWRLGAEKPNEDFYKPSCFVLDENAGCLYLLDSGNSRILCFSKDGQFLFKFGRRGQGPGELSDRAKRIKKLSDGKLYIIDNPNYRISVFDLRGNFLTSAKTSAYYDDIELIEGTYFFSNIILKEGHKPLNSTSQLGTIEKTFGLFVEPAKGIIDQIDRLPQAEPFRYIYRDSSFTDLLSTPKKELIFSQDFPYRLIKYSLRGEILRDIMVPAEYDTYGYINLVVEKDTVGISSPPLPRVFDPFIMGKDTIIVPNLNPEKTFLFLDFFDLDLNLIERYRMKNNIADPKKKEYITHIVVDHENYLYALISSAEEYPRLVKLKMIF